MKKVYMVLLPKIYKLNYELLHLTSTEDCQLSVLLFLSCIFHDNGLQSCLIISEVFLCRNVSTVCCVKNTSYEVKYFEVKYFL